MKFKLGIPALALLCSVTAFGQGAQLQLPTAPARGFPTDDTAYKSTHRPKPVKITQDMRLKDDAVARREWMRERMGGPLTSEFRDAMLGEIAAVQSSYPSLYKPGAVHAGAAGTWTNIGPVRSNWIQNGVRLTKSDTGRVRTILVDPANADIVYLLTSGGGLWKTTNFLSPRPAWAPKSDGVSAAGGAVAFGSGANTVILGTGDPFDEGLGGFVVKSTDGGDTWSAPDALGFATWVTDIKVDGSTVFVGTNSGLWRSDDGGESYVAAGPTATPFGVSARNHPAFTAWSIARANGAWVVTYGVSGFYGAIYRSTDGVNWTATKPFTGDPASDVGRTTLAVGEAGDQIVYAFANELGNGSQKDLYRSNDGGQTWTPVGLKTKKPANPNDDQPDMDIMAGQAFYNHMIIVDPTDADRNTVYIGGQLSSAKSTDGGQTWRLISNWLAQYGLPYVHADFHAAAFAPQTKTLLFGTDGGLFTSTDSGKTWSDQKNDGIASYLVYALATNDKNTSDVIIGLQDNGTRIRVGNGNTYNQVFGGDGFGVGWASDGVSMGSVYYSFLIRTLHGAPANQNKWFVGYNGITEFLDKDGKWPNPAETQFITNIHRPSRAAAPDGRTFYHRTKFKLYRTTNSAASWQPVSNFKLTGPSPEFRGVAHPIATGYDNQQEIAVTMSGGNVAISTDGGQTMRVEALNAPRIPGMASFVTAAAWGHQDELYVSTENPNPASPHLVRSKDAGLTWERLDGVGADPAKRLPRVPISRILVSPTDRKTIFVGSWIGVWVSKDAGATWAPLGSGLPLAIVNDMYISPDGGLLRVASYGRGIWDYRF
jgi:photosystem II stability/assembly factor-like uncharacterized protein